jgi:hypothetical protein
VHYLRTLNPFNPENLAAYPRRLGSNRTNAYAFPGQFLKLNELLDGSGTGPQSFETRHCQNGVPTTIDNGVLNPLKGVPLIGETLANNIEQFAFTTFSSGQVSAPPCVAQPDYSPTTSPPSATTSRYPHVEAAASGSEARRKK